MDTPEIILICIILCFGFGLESIFGFAGTIISLTILSFFFDIKDMILLSIFASSFGSLFIFLSDYASFHSKAFWQTLLFGVPGLLLGTFFLKNFSSEVIKYTFAGFLLLFSAWTIWSPKFSIPQFLKPPINFIGGIFGGIFGTPGPFFVATTRSSFNSKSEMRASLAAIFLTLNVLRLPLYIQSGVFNFEKVIPFWWVIFPFFTTIWLGHKIHVKLSERTFQIGVSILLGIAGLTFFV